jgi:hypothetical protein
MATKPEGVSDEAICIPPSPLTQPKTIAEIEEINANSNYKAVSSWADGMRQWWDNAKRDYAADQPLKERPKKPDVYRTEVTYADEAGNVQNGPHADDGQNFAWVETITT